MTFEVEFAVVDTPVSQGSKRNLGNGRMVEANGAKLKVWREAVKSACQVAMPEGHQPLDQPVVVFATFYLKRPLLHYVSGKVVRGLRPDAPVYCPKSPDLDKLLRGVLDAITVSGLWIDDSRVVRLVTSKRYCNPKAFPTPGVRIRVVEAKE